MAKKDWDFIKYRLPYSVPVVEQHSLSHVLDKSEKFESFLDKKTKQLKTKGIDVSISPEYLEVIVDEYITNLIRELEQAHHNHLKQIKNLFRSRAADKKEIEEMLEEINIQILSTETELAFVKDLYEKSNPLHKLANTIEKFEEDN